jgi:hypothetical protein
MKEEQTITAASPQAPPYTWSVGEAYKALQELKNALDMAEVVLPSLDIQRGHSGSPLIDLGRARPDVIEDLSEVIRRGVLARE